MKKLLIFIIFILISCSPITKKSDLNFSDDISFEELKIKLIEYANNNPYPNIDE